jgi:hypothetical protein
MHKMNNYRLLNVGLTIGLALTTSGLCKAQDNTRATPTREELYCSGVVSDKPVPNNLYVVSGEDSSYKSTFQQGDTIYINAGGEQGVRIGDEFDIVRPENDPMSQAPWFKYQVSLSKAMGTRYADIGRLRVVHVDAKTSTTEIVFGCDFVQRGDIVRATVARPAPQFRDSKLDSYAAPSGKKMAMVVSTRDYGSLVGAGSVVYVNLGEGQGVKIGDYFRVFRYQGSRNETIYSMKDSAFKMYGFGSTPVAYQWNNLPRQIVGEGIVLRTGTNSSTVLLTGSRNPVYAGDYVEVE